jgi:hypothetical protein
MIRNLFVIACASLVLAALCLGGAAALGGPHFFRHLHNNWTVRLHDGEPIRHVEIDAGGDGTAISRDLTWGGGDALDIDIPADVQFTQGAGPAKITISGPKDLVDRVELSGSHLQFSDDPSGDGKLTVVMTAPGVRKFSIAGDASLAIAGYDQDALDVDVSGHGDVTAKGKARTARVDISGDGDVNLGALPVDSAEADISGSGEVDLLSHPAKLTSDVSGSGRIVEGEPAKPS